jgi:hypothetical protein
MTLTVVADILFSETPAIQVDVTSSPSVTDLLTLYRVHEGGSKYRVLTASHATLIGSASVIDYHMPFNTPVQYQAVAGGLTSALSAPVEFGSESVWLIHPTDPSLSLLVDFISAVGDFSYANTVLRSKVLNSKLPRHRPIGPREGEKGSLTILAEDLSTRRAIMALLADGGQILLNTPWDETDLGWKWVQPDTSGGHNLLKKRESPREYSFGYEETTQPDADVRVRTYGEMKALFPTQTNAQMKLIYSTYKNSKLDIRSP